MMTAILWRRLDTAGHDACRLAWMGRGWRLDGAAVFRQENVPACLAYSVVCDGGWRTRKGVVQGWLGGRRIELRVEHAVDGAWTLNGHIVPHLDGCVDADFGFTPATNTLQLRRVALEVGQAVDVPVAWLDVSAGTLDVLHQRYERRDATRYWYEAPRFDFCALLEVRGDGFVGKYPDLWEAEF
jgi:hypothetical protein